MPLNCLSQLYYTLIFNLNYYEEIVSLFVPYCHVLDAYECRGRTAW